MGVGSGVFVAVVVGGTDVSVGVGDAGIGDPVGIAVGGSGVGGCTEK